MKSIISCVVLVFTAAVFLPSFVSQPAPPPMKVKIPTKVNTIIQDKCYGCHSADGKSQKAKSKLLWDDLGSLDITSLKGKVEGIQKVLDKGTMPPKKMVEKDPSKGLTDKESASLAKWASKLQKKISKVSG